MRWQPPIIAISIGCLTATTFNFLGWLQISERKLYDYYLKSRPQEPQDKKVIIIGLNEQDIDKFGFPISDKILASLLTKVKAGNPRVIGLDLHRNAKIGEQNNQRLEQIFSSTPQLMGVEKTDGGNPHHQSISPPSQLEKSGQTGASEIIEDGENGVVRRGYLYVQQSTESEMLPSFGLAVALKYLEPENYFPTSYSQKSWLKLGKAVFPMLQSNRLFYPSADIDNYQTIINYRSSNQRFLQISVTDVLENKVKANFFQDKIIFIGTTAETIKDIYQIPYSYDTFNHDYNFIYGVEIHASLTSQIINATLNNRANIVFLPTYWQYSWLIFFLSITSLGSWMLYIKNIFFSSNKTIIHFVYVLLNSIFILTIGYVLLLWGWWIPTVTSLVLTLSSGICIYFFIRLDKLKQINLILEQKVKQRTQALEAAQKKILSQEKLALYQKLSEYIAHEIKNKTNIIGLNIQNSHTDIEELRLIIEDNSFLFEDITPITVRSPQQLILDLNNKLLRIQSINQKVTSIINEIYVQNSNSNVSSFVDLNLLLDQLVSDALQICEVKYDDFNITIKRNYEKNLHTICCVTSDIERAFDNIISNAVYHLYKKSIIAKNFQPIVLITTQNKPKSIEIKIKDNGMGISPEHLPKIFQMFWTTKSSGEGMGLGLHFAKELIEKNNGKVSVASVEGEYTEFTIIFPV